MEYDFGIENKNLIKIPIELSSDESITKAVGLVNKKIDKLDLLINNAEVINPPPNYLPAYFTLSALK